MPDTKLHHAGHYVLGNYMKQYTCIHVHSELQFSAFYEYKRNESSIGVLRCVTEVQCIL